MTRLIPLFTHKVRIAMIAGLITLACGAVPAMAAHDGEKLYGQFCAACHGHRGVGGVGVPLSLPDFLSTVDDDYLHKTIRLGRPGRVMPAFRQLSDAEVSALVSYIRGWSPAASSAAVRMTSIKGDASHGEKLYARYCVACHGEHGEGGHGTGVTLSRPRDLPVLAPALNNPGFLAAASDALIKTTLMRGRQGTPMPSFLKQGLKEADINDVVAYVRTLEHKPATPSIRAMAEEPPTIVRASPYTMDQTIEKLKIAIGAANMRLIRTEAFDQPFWEKGAESKHHVVIDSCDFDFLDKALKVDPRAGLFLPCRFTLTENHGKVSVMAINPKRLSAIFNNSELDQLCDQMYHVYVDIIEEATL
jgi:cytochrome c oxidase cbb3-type subunit 3